MPTPQGVTARVTYTAQCPHPPRDATDPWSVEYVPVFLGREGVWALWACSEACFTVIDPHRRPNGPLQLGRLSALPDGCVRLLEPHDAATPYLAG